MFAFGENTSASTVTADGINLLYFDLQGVNFPPPTSVIAFLRRSPQVQVGIMQPNLI